MTVDKPNLDGTSMQVLYNACLGTSLDPSFLHITNLWILSDPCNIQRHTFVTLNFHLDNFLSTPPIIILFCWSSWNTFWHGVPTMQTSYEFMPLKGSPPHHFKGGKPWPTNCFRLKTPFGASFFIQMSKYVRFQSSVYLDPSIAYQMGFSIEFCIPLTILSFGVFQIVY